MNIYEHELEAYKKEISQIKTDFSPEKINTEMEKNGNLTHYALGVSNRANMLLVALCGLAETFLADIALEHESETAFKLTDIKCRGREKYKRFLGKLNVIDFGTLINWADFKNLYTVRNNIVHSSGGLVENEDSQKLQKLTQALERLDFKDILVAERRIRVTPEALNKTHEIVDGLISEICKIVEINW